MRVTVFLLLSSASRSLAQSTNAIAANAMAQVRTVLTGMVQANSRLTPEFLRLGFHDCIGGCDGCVDLSNPANNGLADPISVLDPIVQQFATLATGLSRADIWAIAAMVGADAANHGQITQPINFTQNWFGRVDCENANSVCLNAAGQSVQCSETLGPNRVIPSATFNTAAVFSYFASNFGFNQRQTVAIMGVHTVGRLLKNESGIDAPHGWTINNVNLDNEYYNALMGAATALTPVSEMEANSPNWVRKLENNTGTSFPNINRWELDVSGLQLNMLDSDVALVRDLNASNSETTFGAVSCTFNSQTGSPACPPGSTIDIAAEFSDDNDLWLSEFNAAMDLVLTNGYNRIACSSSVCPLTTNRIGPPSAPIQPVAPISRPVTPPTPLPPTVPVHSAPSPYVVPLVSPPVSPQSLYMKQTGPPPTPPPTRPPTKPPTPPPSPPPTKTSPSYPPPPTPQSYSKSCCTQTFAACVTYCGTTEQQCKSCGDTTVVWSPNGVPPYNTCIPRWGDCTKTGNGCCPGLTCVVGNPWWKSCEYVY